MIKSPKYFFRSDLHFLMLVALLTFSNAYAVVGSANLINTRGPESLCRLLIRSQHGLRICSGTLIESNKILTANHCTNNDRDSITVECGYEGVNNEILKYETTLSGNTVVSEGILFKTSSMAKVDFRNIQSDQALLSLTNNLNLTPMKVALPNMNTQNFTDCYIGGYGLNKDIITGELTIGKIELPILKRNQMTTVAYLQSTFNPVGGKFNNHAELRTLIRSTVVEKMSSPIPLPGDSGGPIFCKAQNNEFYLVGILSTISGHTLVSEKSSSQTNSTHFVWAFVSQSNKPDLQLLKGLNPEQIENTNLDILPDLP